MIDSVKSIPTNPLSEPFIGAGIYSRWFRQLAVKGSVEHGHLENRPDAFLDDLDPFQLSAVMERCKSGHARYRRFHFRRDSDCLTEVLATVHDTMTYSRDFWRCGNHAQLSIP